MNQLVVSQYPLPRIPLFAANVVAASQPLDAEGWSPDSESET